jgi:hypothetical protein
MLRFPLAAAVMTVGIAPGFAQAPPPAPRPSADPMVLGQNGPSGSADAGDQQPSELGEDAGDGRVIPVPRSMGLPPGAVILIPRTRGLPSETAGQSPGGAGPPERGVGAAAAPVNRARGGAMLRLRRGHNEFQVRCGADATLQSCIRIVAPLLQSFFSAPAPGVSGQTAPPQGSSSGSEGGASH